jgi:hypothetical protein
MPETFFDKIKNRFFFDKFIVQTNENYQLFKHCLLKKECKMKFLIIAAVFACIFLKGINSHELVNYASVRPDQNVLNGNFFQLEQE